MTSGDGCCFVGFGPIVYSELQWRRNGEGQLEEKKAQTISASRFSRNFKGSPTFSLNPS